MALGEEMAVLHRLADKSNYQDSKYVDKFSITPFQYKVNIKMNKFII